LKKPFWTKLAIYGSNKLIDRKNIDCICFWTFKIKIWFFIF
jgi:hypothetical protein